jgi:hypothetical protein
VCANTHKLKLGSISFRAFVAQAEDSQFGLGEPLYELGDAIKYVYFPNDSIVSLISELAKTGSYLNLSSV